MRATNLTLARLKLEADRAQAHRKMRGLEGKARGFMETRRWSDADVEKMLTSDKVLNRIARDIERTEP